MALKARKKRHIFRKSIYGLLIAGAGLGPTAAWGATTNFWGLADNKKAESAPEEAKFAGTAVKIGDKYFKIDNGKLTNQQLYFTAANIAEDGTTASVFVPGKGFVTYNILPTTVIVQKLDGSYTIGGVTYETTDSIQDNTMIDFGENGGQQFVKLLTEVVVEDGKAVYYRANENGVDRIVLDENKIYALDGKFYYEPSTGSDLIEVVEVNEKGENVSAESSLLKEIAKEFGVEQDPEPEAPTDPTPGTSEDEEQKDPETPGDEVENPGESNTVEGQDKNVTYSDLDALKQLNANLAKILASKDFFKGKEVTEASVEILDLEHGMLVVSATVDGVKLNYSTTLNMNDKVDNLDRVLADVVMNKVVTAEGKDNAVSAINNFDTNMVTSNFHEVAPITLSLKDKDGKSIDNTVYLMKSNRVQGNAYQQLYCAYVDGTLYQFQIEVARKDMNSINTILQNNLQQFINEGKSELLNKDSVKVVDGWLLSVSSNVVITVEESAELDQ